MFRAILSFEICVKKVRDPSCSMANLMVGCTPFIDVVHVQEAVHVVFLHDIHVACIVNIPLP